MVHVDPGEFEDLWAAGERVSFFKAVCYATRRRGVRARPSRGWESRIRTELDVARLEAEGLSNPEVAERLFVPRNTVHNHLEHVFISPASDPASSWQLRPTRRD